MKAAYIQTGIKTNVRSLRKLYIDSRVSKDWQIIAANVFLITKALQEKQITLKWSF